MAAERFSRAASGRPFRRLRAAFAGPRVVAGFAMRRRGCRPVTDPGGPGIGNRFRRPGGAAASPSRTRHATPVAVTCDAVSVLRRIPSGGARAGKGRFCCYFFPRRRAFRLRSGGSLARAHGARRALILGWSSRFVTFGFRLDHRAGRTAGHLRLTVLPPARPSEPTMTPCRPLRRRMGADRARARAAFGLGTS